MADFLIEPAVQFVKGEARGRLTLRLEHADGLPPSIVHTETGNWFSGVVRTRFANKCAAKLHPSTHQVGGEDPRAYKARAKAVDRAREDTAEKIDRAILAKLDEMERAATLPVPANRDLVAAAHAKGANGRHPRLATQTVSISQRQEDPGELPVVPIGTDEFRVTDETIRALAADPDLYQRGGMLVRVNDDTGTHAGVRRDGSKVIGALPLSTVRERITKFAAFTKTVRRGEEFEDAPAHPPQWLVTHVFSRGIWPGIRPLSALSDAPVLRPDGTVWQTPGYDDLTRVLYQPSGRYPAVSADATIDDADAAVEALKEVVCDFNFEAPEHRAAWFAGLLSPLARFAYEGPTPLTLFDANVRGAGKGLLAHVLGRIVLGREMPLGTYAHNPEEMAKRITSIALAGDRVVNLDNVEGAFGNSALDAALTSTRWTERVLGKSEQVDLPLYAVWYATGNNVAVEGDTGRRIIHCRLDVLEEHPEERTGFRHPDLARWVTQERPRLLAAALTILTAYCNAGRPSQGLSPWGSFGGWSDLVRSALVWAGLPDPGLTRGKLHEKSDTTTEALDRLISVWRTYDALGTGVVVSEMLARLYPNERQYTPNKAEDVAMRAALEQFVGCPPGKTPSARQVGSRLRSYRRRVISGVYLDADPSKGEHGLKWRLHQAPGE